MKRLAPLLLLVAISACGGSALTSADDQNFTSDVATLLVMEFDSQLLTTSISSPAGQIRAQLMYTVGHLNAEPGVLQRHSA